MHGWCFCYPTANDKKMENGKLIPIELFMLLMLGEINIFECQNTVLPDEV